MAVKELTNSTFDQAVKDNKWMVIDFYATWCAPCSMLSPIVEKVSEEFEDVAFYKVDIDDNMADDETHVSLDFRYNGKDIHSEADGNGPIDAVKLAVRQCVPQIDFSVLDYSEHSLGKGSGAKAAAYIEMRDNRNGNVTYGVGVSSNITRASIRGMFSAMNRIAKKASDYV